MSSRDKQSVKSPDGGAYKSDMRSRTASYREAIEHLPDAALLVFEDVVWDDYETLLEDLEERPGMRVTYDHGRIEITSPSRRHEQYKELITATVHVVVEELQHLRS